MEMEGVVRDDVHNYPPGSRKSESSKDEGVEDKDDTGGGESPVEGQRDRVGDEAKVSKDIDDGRDEMKGEDNPITDNGDDERGGGAGLGTEHSSVIPEDLQRVPHQEVVVIIHDHRPESTRAALLYLTSVVKNSSGIVSVRAAELVAQLQNSAEAIQVYGEF